MIGGVHARLAATLGFALAIVDYGVMAAVSITVVGAFESAGAILVVAMLVVPPATAYLLTDRLSDWSPIGLCDTLRYGVAAGGFTPPTWAAPR